MDNIENAAPVETPAPAAEPAPAPTVRGAIEEAMRTAEAKVAAKPAPEPVQTETRPESGKPRDATGKFAPKAAEGAPETPVAAPDAKTETGVVEPPKAAIKAPQSLKGELKAKFNELPDEWQGEIARLEDDARRGLQKNAQLAQFGQALHAEFQPYEALLRAAGATPQQALRSFLQNEYILRSGTPAQKQATATQLLKHYGIDLTGIQSGEQPQIDPNIAYLSQEVQRLRQEREQDVSQRTNQESAQVNSAIDQFAADPKHPHFQDVRLHMGALMEAGAAKDLDDAYEQACWANPSIREQLTREKNQAAEAKRKEDERKRVEAKKAAGVSIHGTPAAPIPAAVKGESVGQTLRRVAQQAQGRI